MADKFACMHCGFVFEDPDMEVCPRCGTELGQEWDPAELRSFVVTELTEEQAKFVATLTAGSTAEEILSACKNDGCFALENLTPRQVEAYAEFLKQEGIPFVAETEEQKAVRLQKQLEAKTAQRNAEAARAQAKSAEARAQAEADAKVKMEQEAKSEAARAQAEAETEKARLATITAKVEAEARAKAQTELEKYKLEFQAKQSQKRKRFGCLFAVLAVPAVIIIAMVIATLFDMASDKKKASDVADLKVMLRDDPFLTYENYKQANPGKLTLAEFDAVYQQKDYADARKKTAGKQTIKRVDHASGWQTGKAVTYTISDGVTLEMMPCPAGSFTMGSPSDEEGRYDDEKPHRVTLTKPFLIGKYEVTQAQYKAVMGKNPSYFPSPDRPVEKVSWKEAMVFCDELNEITKGVRPAGYRFTLPTEAQWEYACRAGTNTALNNGRNMVIIGINNAPALDKVGWYGGNCGQDFSCSESYNISGWKEKQYDDARGGTHPVGRKAPNAWGIYDMHGNVWEWCLDWYSKEYGEDATDPTGPSTGSGRVSRGGSWDDSARDCRSADRSDNDPGYRFSYLGFRLALVPVQ